MKELKPSQESRQVLRTDEVASNGFAGVGYSHNVNSVLVKINDKWLYDGAKKTIAIKDDQLKISLREKTASVLNLLIENNRNVVDTSHFFSCIWEGRYVSENVLKQSIKELRDCLNDSRKTLIKTMPRRGYCLDASIEFELLPRVDSAELSTDSPKRASPRVDPPVTNKTPEYKPRNAATCVRDGRSNYARWSSGCIGLIVSFKHYLRVRVRWIASILAVTLVSCLFIAGNDYRSLTASHERQAIRVAESRARIQFHQDVLLRYLSAPEKDSETLKSILKKSMAAIDSYRGSDVEKLGMLYALFDLYRLSGFYGESRAVFSRLEKMVVTVFGGHSDELYRLRFLLIDILIKLKQREEAYNLSRITLDQIKQFHHPNRHLLASAYYYSARGLLFCVAPFCKRGDVLGEGEAHTREALRLHRQHGSSPIDIADTLWLLNWFIWEGDEKIRISEQVLNTYLDEVGELNEKTAAALEQLARTLTFWNQDWDKGESLLLRALSIRKSLFPGVHPEMARIYSYLGEHYFMTRQFTAAIENLTKAITITDANLGEGGGSLQDKMLLARAELYRGDSEQAARWIALAYDVIDRYKLTYSDIVLNALKVTELRVKLARGEIKDLDDVLKNIIDTADKFKSPKFVLLHEYYSILLKHSATNVADDYLNSIRQISTGMKPKNRYFYQADFFYLEERASHLCSLQGEAFCKAVAAAFDSKLTPQK